MVKIIWMIQLIKVSNCNKLYSPCLKMVQNEVPPHNFSEENRYPSPENPLTTSL